MLKVRLIAENGVAVLEPKGALERGDFESAASIIDPFIEAQGTLKGLIIHVEHFPGWDSFGALVQHLKFVRTHHQKIERIGLVTESPIGGLAEKTGRHFIKAEIREFPYNDFDQAMAWAEKSEQS